MSDLILPMINRGADDALISDAVIKNMQTKRTNIRAHCVQTYSCEHSFTKGGLASGKCIHIQFGSQQSNLISRLCKKVLNVVLKILEFIGLYSSNQLEDKNLVADYILGIKQSPKYDKKFYEICKNLNGVTIVAEEGKTHPRRTVDFL